MTWLRVGLVAMLCHTPTATAAGVNVAAGEATFRAACMSCHQIGPRARGGFGPQLNSIVGRLTAADGTYRYSAALREARFTWTEERLAAFIRRPSEVVPGTSMRFRAIGYDAQKMNDLLAYLRSLPAPPAGPQR